ncbi:MAG: hypothetical protein K8F91_09465 [Candidatus Obscuribacterales bacterium]|nr:hypothetical protein [Candidatus Obscuribacterales bacterium]
MSTVSELLIQLKPGQSANDFVHLLPPGSKCFIKGNWFNVPYPVGNPPWKSAESVSRELSTNVLIVLLQTTSDVFLLAIYRNGQEVRHLEWTGESGWSVKGIPEPWEPKVFFQSQDLDEMIEQAADPAEENSIRETFKKMRLSDGSSWPGVDGSTLEALWVEIDFRPSLPGDIAAVKQRHPLDILGMGSCTAGGIAILINGIHAQYMGMTGGIGFLIAWIGFAILFRRASVVLVLGGGLIAAVLLLLVSFFVGKLLGAVIY